jgi:hypothetical protein
MSHQRGVRLFWPIILIGVGSILLLSNVGVIQGNPWSIIFQLWPVLLIALGLEILFGGSTGWRAIVSALLGLVLVGGILWVLIAQPAIPGLNFSSSSLQTTTIAYPRNEVQTARANIAFGVGTNRVYALEDSSNLIEGELQTYTPVTFNVSQSGTQADIQLAPGGPTFTLLPLSGEEKWTIGLNSAVTYQIDFSMGVGQSRIDLGRLDLSGGSIEGGVGQSDFWLPASGRYTLRVEGGVGSIRIYVPRDLAVRAEVNGGLGSFNRLPGMQETRDDVYETAGFASAENAVTLIIDGGVGSITLLAGE